MNKHFVFHASYYECVQRFPPETQKNIIYNLVRYAISGIEPTNTTPEEELAFVLMKPALDKSLQNMANGSKNSLFERMKKQGYMDCENERQSKSESEVKSETQSEVKSETASESGKSLSSSLLYQNNIKETDKQTLYVNNKNKLSVRTREEITEKFKLQNKTFFDFHQQTEFGVVGNEIVSTMADYAVKAQSKPIKFNGKLYNAEDVEQLFASADADKFQKIVQTIKFSEDIKDRERYIFGCFLH